VTSIEDYVFYNCSALESVSLPNSAVSIGEQAFYDCKALMNVVIPDGVTSIGVRAFQACRNLMSVTIPESTTWIRDYTFYKCSDLTSVTIGKDVTNIGLSAFEGTAYYNDTKNWDNDSLYIGDYLIQAKCDISGAYTVKDGTKTIADRAFYKINGLTSVTIPNGVTSIGGYAFYACDNLASVTIGKDVTSIGSFAFGGTAYYNDTDNWDNGVLYIGNYLIKVTGNISGSYTIKAGTTVIADLAFDGRSKMTSVTIPDSVKAIGAEAFYDCGNLTSVTIGNNVTAIGAEAFYGCDRLTKVTFENVSGWRCACEAASSTNDTELSALDLADSETAATYLTDTYLEYNWYRKAE
jgi:hypothetical protein